MSGLNNFLRGIQRNRPNLTPPYAGFGDYSYGVNLECLRSYYWVYFPPAQLTEYMTVCDAEFKSCRQGIERVVLWQDREYIQYLQEFQQLQNGTEKSG